MMHSSLKSIKISPQIPERFKIRLPPQKLKKKKHTVYKNVLVKYLQGCLSLSTKSNALDKSDFIVEQLSHPQIKLVGVMQRVVRFSYKRY